MRKIMFLAAFVLVSSNVFLGEVANAQEKSVKKEFKMTPEFKKLAAQYEYISTADDGRMYVKDNGFSGMLDKSGKLIVPCRYNYVSIRGEHIITQVERAYQLMDAKGKFICSGRTEYELYSNMKPDKKSKKQVKEPKPFQLMGKWGMRDANGNTIVNPKYDMLSYDCGYAEVRRNHRYGYIDSTGVETVPCKYDQIDNYNNLESNTYRQVRIGNRNGLVDVSNGHEVIPCEYEYADNFSEGLAVVKLNGKYGYMNEKSETVIPLRFDKARPFTEGLAVVMIDDKWGFIDKSGNTAIALDYEEAERFHSGMAAVKKDGLWGYVNEKGKLVIPCKYTQAYDFHNGQAQVKINDKWCVIDKSGSEAWCKSETRRSLVF